MPDDVTTEDTDDLIPKPAVERDEWKIAFEPLEGDYAAIRMGFNITLLKKHLDTQLFKPRPVMEALDLAMEALFPLTPFHSALSICSSSSWRANSLLKKKKC